MLISVCYALKRPTQGIRELLTFVLESVLKEEIILICE
jgi:hypothetical protein